MIRAKNRLTAAQDGWSRAWKWQRRRTGDLPVWAGTLDSGNPAPRWRAPHAPCSLGVGCNFPECTRVGFTFVELLVCVAVIGVLSSLIVPVIARSMDASRQNKCSTTMRGLSQGILLWASDHDGELPRSSHSAFGYQQRGWAKSILPYLGEQDNPDNAVWLVLQKRYFRCPADSLRTSGLSYGLNSFFELDPGIDDYQGSPQQWRRLASIPKPTRTVLLAEVPATADHVMAHFWEEGGFGYDVDIDRHSGKSQFSFADGHVEVLPVEATFNPALSINLWNPSLAM